MPVKTGAEARRKKKLPPGQRLLRFLSVAMAIVCSISVYVPAGTNETEIDMNPPCVAPQLPAPFEKREELSDLSESIKKISDKPKLKAGLFAVEPASGRYLSLSGDDSFSAASMIKVPVLVKLLDSIDKGDVDAKEILTLRKDLIGGGSGYLQWRPAGSKVSLKEAMESMIIFSDNTATNLIIDRVGGKDICNRDFIIWGLRKTYINDWLPDLPGTNKTSPQDLVHLLARVDKGHLLTPASRQRMLAIMERTRTRTLLPPGLPPGAKISHKTGDIGSLVGDCGIITSPTGKRYIVAVQVARPHNDRRANEMIRQISKNLYVGMVNDGSEALAGTGMSGTPAGTHTVAHHRHSRHHSRISHRHRYHSNM
ncbi:MAG: class A beta-lactamase-related serine hydrolase [Candidatus Obscuribacterales bacterium]|jgi:beta-lactamase class A|nr:class A beta-lactamase-related serine hydrolase [Candidatus Obscuribacterales bacterium]MBX9942424.1 class A beta-lactamase-related serine hydrolase [Candidatus Obscuribacterales bacterium]